MHLEIGPFLDTHGSVFLAPQRCIGYLGYPFQNKQGKSCVENLIRDVVKEE